MKDYSIEISEKKSISQILINANVLIVPWL